MRVCDSLMTDFKEFLELVPKCEGYMIDRLSFSQIEDLDSLELGLRWGPRKPDITLAFRHVLYFLVGRASEPSSAPLNEVAATVLPPEDASWPDGVFFDTIRTASLPSLVWFRAEGPVQLSIIASIATASIEAIG